MKTLLVSIVVALVAALGFVACERVVVLTPLPGDGGNDSSFIPDAYVDYDGGSHLDGAHFPDASPGLD